MASYEQTRDMLMRQYPSLHPTEHHVLIHLFVHYGNGFRWRDGELVDLFPEPDAEVFLRRAKSYAKSYASFARISRRAGEEPNDDIVKAHRKPVPPITMLHAPSMMGYEAVLNIPDNIKPDWLDAAWRAYHLICSIPGWPCTMFTEIWNRLFYLWRSRRSV
jgi:hypothetical protein